MRKMIRWYLALLLLAAVCILGVWAVSSRSKEPTNATLVWNIPGSRKQDNPGLREQSDLYSWEQGPGRDIGVDAGIQKNPGTEACRL